MAGHSHHHTHAEEHESNASQRLAVAGMCFSAVMLIVGILLSHFGVAWFSNTIQMLWYIIAFLPVGIPVMHEAIEEARSGDPFNEFLLMSIAAIGAFCIGEFPEAVAVMLLYTIGEALQDKAEGNARKNISSLVASRPDKAYVVEGETIVCKDPKDVKIGDFIEIKVGERVPLDGLLQDASALFDTAALTGESVPREIEKGETVLAGMIPSDTPIRIQTTKIAADSAVERVLKMVEEATERKAPAELFIRRFARIYTPAVICIAFLVVLLPYIWSLLHPAFVFHFTAWFRRALIFLVIACPCALVISIPLSYFGGIGAASRRGILFKGSNFLDAILQTDTVVFDKTGTLTTGEFSVSEVGGLSENDLQVVAAMEQTSTHPIARAIIKYVGAREEMPKLNVSTLAGRGLKGEDTQTGDVWLVGTLRLLAEQNINTPNELDNVAETLVVVAKNAHFIGFLKLSDTLKTDAESAISALRAQGVKRIEMLSGDKAALVENTAKQLHLDAAHGDLLPQDKLQHVTQLCNAGHNVVFVGDGINDAPVLAASTVGVAMGAMGADLAVETADIVLQTDQPSRVAEAIAIGRRTRKILKENIVLAIGVKLAVLVLGCLGIATIWEAVFADSGVALLAVLNSLRVLRVKHRAKNA